MSSMPPIPSPYVPKATVSNALRGMARSASGPSGMSSSATLTARSP